jgi:hypothetical protein
MIAAVNQNGANKLARTAARAERKFSCMLCDRTVDVDFEACVVHLDVFETLCTHSKRCRTLIARSPVDTGIYR